jgi:hypothetical protein
MKLLLSVFFVFILSEGHAAILDSKQMSYWHKLLHFRPNLLGKMVSEVDSKNFFVSKDGKTSPEGELEKFIELLNSDKAQSYVCKFPLRYKWLKQTIMNDWGFTTESCTVYNSFVEKLGAKNLSLVFSSYYIKNPASTFGHTFIRVRRYDDFRTNEMLDNAFNFSAENSTDQVLIYMLKGLTGFYKGQFSSVPYYYKIREYNDYEFRDLWDYDLNLSQDQVNRVVDHVWEMGSIYFDYYYFTENCSYHMLGLLNVAYDDIDILENLNRFFVLPVETIREMQRLGLIRQSKVRASAYKKLIKHTKGYAFNDLRRTKEIAKDPFKANEILKNLGIEKQAEIMDSSILAFDYFNIRDIYLGKEKTVAAREHLLVIRAENPVITDEVKFKESEVAPPEDSHKSSRLGLSGGSVSQQGAFTEISWRAAQHDLLDPSKGQLKNSQVVIFDFDLRYKKVDEEFNKFSLERFRVLDFKKYQPSDYWSNSISWDFAFGTDQRIDCPSGDCIQPTISSSAGSSVELGSEYLLSFLLGGKLNYDKVYENDVLLKLGPKINFLILTETWSSGIDITYFFPGESFDEWERRTIDFNLEIRYFLKKQISLFFKTSRSDQADRNLQHSQIGIHIFH